MALAGVWKQHKHEGFSDYLKAINLGAVKRTLVLNMNPKMTIEIDGEKWKISTTTPVSTQVMEFTVGVEFETTMPGVSDEPMKCTATLDGDKLSTRATPAAAGGELKAFDTVREIVDGELLMTMTCGDVVAKRYFKKE